MRVRTRDDFVAIGQALASARIKGSYDGDDATPIDAAKISLAALATFDIDDISLEQFTWIVDAYAAAVVSRSR